MGDEALLHELFRARLFPSGQIGPQAGLLFLFQRRRVSLSRRAFLSHQVLVPEFEQHLPLLHALALLDSQLGDLAAGGSGEFRAAACLDGSGTGVVDRRLDFAAFCADQLDDGKIRAGEVPQGGCDQRCKQDCEPGFFVRSSLHECS